MLQLNSARFNRSDLPYYCYGDSRSFYETNLLKQDKDWPWRNRKVEYHLNSQGFRCPEWSSIDWDRSIVCFGCSMTFGVGVDGPDTWVSQLGQILGVSTVNLGWPGASVGFMWANSLELIRAGIRPRAVIYYWPDAARVCEFLGGGQVYNWGIWEQTQQRSSRPWLGSLGQAWIERDRHALASAHYMMDSLSWPCARLDLTWDFSGQYQGRAEHLHFMTDRARDLGHPGVASHRDMARAVAARLKI
jgi:hypothetical protein